VGKFQTKIPPPERDVPPDHIFSLREAATWLAEMTKDTTSAAPTGRMQRRNVYRRIQRAIKKGPLETVGSPRAPQITAEKLVAWARVVGGKPWQEALPAMSVHYAATAQDPLSFTDRMGAWVFPGTIDQCHKLLSEMYQRLERREPIERQLEIDNLIDKIRPK
jgi:hypothetical protein